MRLFDIIGMAFYNLWRRKLRTSLTVLAVVIGAMLIALMTSIGSGLQSFIVGQFGMTVPQDALTVYATEGRYFGDSTPYEITDTASQFTEPFTEEDIDALLAVDGVERVDYSVSVSALYVSPEGSDKKYSVSLNTGPGYEISVMDLIAGNYFDENDTGKCLISYDYLAAFGWSNAGDAIGRSITVTVGKANSYNPETADYSFVITGVIQKTVSSTQIVIPMTDAIDMVRYYQDNPVLYSEEQPGLVLLVKVTDADIINQVANDVRAAGFNTITPDEILSEINNVFNIIQIVLSAFGGIALVVASIGIINTLMMSIYERTREIGVMKAVGATRGTIRMLFTMEGAALGFIGGIIGVAIGYGAGQALNIIGSRTFLSDYPNFEMSVFSVMLVVEVVAVTTAISLLAGLYPANRAAKLDAVDALRYE